MLPLFIINANTKTKTAKMIIALRPNVSNLIKKFTAKPTTITTPKMTKYKKSSVWAAYALVEKREIVKKSILKFNINDNIEHFLINNEQS